MTETDPKIETITQLRARSDPYTSSVPKVNGGGAALIPISLVRVKWLERPELYPELSCVDERLTHDTER